MDKLNSEQIGAAAESLQTALDNQVALSTNGHPIQVKAHSLRVVLAALREAQASRDEWKSRALTAEKYGLEMSDRLAAVTAERDRYAAALEQAQAESHQSHSLWIQAYDNLTHLVERHKSITGETYTLQFDPAQEERTYMTLADELDTERRELRARLAAVTAERDRYAAALDEIAGTDWWEAGNMRQCARRALGQDGQP